MVRIPVYTEKIPCVMTRVVSVIKTRLSEDRSAAPMETVENPGLAGLRNYTYSHLRAIGHHNF